MTPEKSPKERDGIKLKPLSGRFFDIKPAKSGNNPPRFIRHGDFFRFAMVTLIAFLILGLGNVYVLGRDMVFESQEAAYDGYENIKMGMDSLLARDAAKAKEYFSKAESSFYELSQTAEPLTSQKNHLLAESLYLDTADKLIKSALEVTQIGQQLAELMQGFSELPQAALSVAGGGDGGLIEALQERKASLDEILALAASLQRKMTTLNDRVLPHELQNKIVSARGQIGRLIAGLLEVDANFDVVLRLLGDQVPHRYLVLFQNNHELRATGGFIGSYLIVDVNDGRIAKMEAKDVYETDGQLGDVVEPPPGIDRVADRLYMRDANYSPDFPTSAKEVMWFLEHSKGPSVDTVIAIDQSVIESLLELTGPLVLQGFPFQVKAENFSDIVSFYTEAKLSETATPKQLLFDLIPAFQKKLGNLENIENLLGLGIRLLEEGHVQAYSADPKVQNLIVRAGLDGGMTKAEAKTDYLSVITTAIGGNKSDQYIKTELHHRSVVGKKGQIEDEMTIKKTHTFSESDAAKIKESIARYGTGKLNEESLLFILGQGPNIDYMRVYVPKGSLLQDASGIDTSAIEVSEDLGYTVFAFTNGPIKVGESKEVTLRYLLPFRLSFSLFDNYQLIAEHQAGAQNMTLKKELITPDSLTITENYPLSDDAFSLTHVIETEFDRNRIFISAIRSGT
ncbi:DUF4012 domain-containing protein [Patescibacteria group bacterium]|nr:DUF4012 domain-containing protein [Patescibacteria group bacterium]MBU1015501.1 DUF4012 domain-containing protein [Patescibacteria group bacterium]MBU1685424.1 DUF4012 domain-containing protein [Patescibacteria group bacterium]MBU1938385.1 DUF4012 domain-containing protein [Patescibacteria group bacterium]